MSQKIFSTNSKIAEPVEEESVSSQKRVINLNKHTFRTTLESGPIDRSTNSIWSILKQCVDKELHRFTVPIVWNEPLSLLQRMAENMKYCDALLDKGADCRSGLDRMKCVAAFLVSGTSIHNNRLSKPFNPLLGETYEYICTNSNFRICCEQVSHHPPISAYYSESIKPSKNADVNPKWKYYGSVNPILKLNFIHASIEAFPEGIQTVEFPEFNEVYTWHNIKVAAHNVVIGKLWFECTGRVEIINHQNKMKCVLDFKPYSWFGGQMSRCEGYIVDSQDKLLSLLYGKWDECFFSCDNPLSKDFTKKVDKYIKDEATIKDEKTNLLWKATHDKLSPDHYLFSHFTYKLNELYDDLLNETRCQIAGSDQFLSMGPLPVTDSRFRPDMRHMEKGNIDEASHEKNRLEEKQRESRSKMDHGQMKEWSPLWFDKKPHFFNVNEETWSFNNKYWTRDFSECPNIY
jgi:hypothetical protein